MLAFLRTAFSTKALRPFTAQHQHQHQPSALANALGANSTEAVRGMKVRSSVKLMCDHCNFVRRRRTVRITGTLHSYSPTTDGAIIVDGQSALIVRTQLLGVVQYHVGQTYQFIGVVGSRAAVNDSEDEKDEGLMVDDAQCARTVELHARVGRVVDGLDMAVYRRAVAALRAADVVDAIA
ncbi:hypothetical protein LPJ66_009029 [Kickxella alabastrina]|uniref:Uncharacterized protein n=1 Tax=Kickxella alabastrina TaxID=61397 RepID=A0ACC1I6W9_9FUNG|nr:hypothetical protein LPJ66_009029 [Kickxella alabastrina]